MSYYCVNKCFKIVCIIYHSIDWAPPSSCTVYGGDICKNCSNRTENPTAEDWNSRNVYEIIIKQSNSTKSSSACVFVNVSIIYFYIVQVFSKQPLHFKFKLSTKRKKTWKAQKTLEHKWMHNTSAQKYFESETINTQIKENKGFVVQKMQDL